MESYNTYNKLMATLTKRSQLNQIRERHICKKRMEYYGVSQKGKYISLLCRHVKACMFFPASHEGCSDVWWMNPAK